jgi:Ca2+-binding RTX toxin-like protein
MRSRHRHPSVRRRPIGCEALEDRTLLAVEALGPEFLVNTVEVGSQSVAQKPNSVAMDDDGNFVVVWQSDSKIFAQRFSRAGAKVGGEIQVSFQNTALSEPVVAMNEDGDFTVAWTAASDDSSGQNATGTGVFARSYDNQGVPFQSWYRVNESAAGNQSSPAVSMDDLDRVVFAFQSSGGSGDSGTDVYVRSFQVQTPIPTVVMPQRRVNTSVTTGNQTNPSISADDLGNFVVAWEGTDASGTGIRTKIYTATGTAVTGEVIANTYTTGNQLQPVVALSPAADLSSTLTARFQVAWSGPGTGDITDGGIYFRRIGVGADPSEIRANVFTAGFQIQPTIAVDYLGGVAVAWTSQFQDGSNFGVYARYFQNLPSGQLQGDLSDRLVNSFTTGVQYLPSVAMDNDGDFVIAYAGEGLLDTNPLGIYARRFSSFLDDDAPQIRGIHAVNAINILDATSRSWEIAEGEHVVSGFNQLRVQFTEPMNVTSILANLSLDGRQLTSAFSALSGVVFNPQTQLWEARFQLAQPLVPGYYRLDLLDSQDVAGYQLDGNNDGLSDGQFARTFSFAPPVQDGAAVSVSNSADYEGDVAMTNEGVTIVTWADSVNEFLADTIYYQLFDRNSIPLTTPLIANNPTAPFRRHPKVATTESGNFVITWLSGSSSSTYESEARLFDSLGVPLTPVFDATSVDISTFSAGQAHVAMTPTGEFVMAWTGLGRTQPNSQDGSGASIMARRFDSAGTPIGPEFLVNTLTAGNQFARSVAADAQGNFVVVWESVDSLTSIKSVRGRRFNAAGTALGNDFAISSNTTRDQEQPEVAMDAEGNFVVIWQDVVGNFVGDNVLLARRYNAAGIADGSPFDVSPPSANGYFYDATLAMDADGDFAITYVGRVQPSPGVFETGIGVLWFDARGVLQRETVATTDFADIDNSEPQLAMTADGDAVVAWRRDPLANDGISFVRFSGSRDLIWHGTDGRDVVTFIELPDGTIQLTETMRNGVAVNTTTSDSNVTGRILAFGYDGNDDIIGKQVSSPMMIANGGDGSDLIIGGLANDRLYGDRLFGVYGGNVTADTLIGWYGNDILEGEEGDDLLFGDARLGDLGSQKIGVLGQDQIYGGNGSDLIYGDSDGGEGASDFIDAGNGNNTVYADGPEGRSAAHDTILAGDGVDMIYADGDGSLSPKSAAGGNDFVSSGGGNDFIDTGGGNDTAEGGTGDDILLGGDGGEGRADYLNGGNGRDILVGDFGHLDNLDLKAGADTLNGGVGEDIILAGALLPDSQAMLFAIQGEWLSNRSFQSRAANISGTGTGPRNNRDSFLIAGTNVFNDRNASSSTQAVDDILGGSDADWIWFESGYDIPSDVDTYDLLIDLTPSPLPSS